jgi:thiamine pyrophosphate-dependent acetolactate synthase large subunit-like protein
MTIDRRAFVARLLAAVPDALVVAGLGSPAYDVFAAGDRDTNFYLWGAMGGAASMGLGLALAQPARAVVVITGDGEQLMGLGSLATIAAQKPANLTVVVLDNARFGETGMQASHTGIATDLAAVARGCGFLEAPTLARLEDADDLARRIKARTAAMFALVKVAAGEAPRVLPPRDGAYLKNRFRKALGIAAL